MIQLEDIRKSYKTGSFTQVALDGVSLTFRENEFVAVLGPSGSGKTTLLNILGGLDHADSGDIVINGVSTKKYKSRDWDTYRNHRIGFIFQSYNLIQHQSVLSNVELALMLAGVSRSQRRERATAELENVGLGEHVHKKPNQLSGGQMQRVAIARALVNDPDIVLADEPTGALDTETGIQVMDLLSKVAADRLVIMVTHNPDLANAYANRIVRLSDGRIIEDSNPYEPEAVSASDDAIASVSLPAVAEAAEPVEGVAADAAGDATEERGVEPADATAQATASAPAEEKSKGRKRQASMSFLTALSLSFSNLMSKKGRTFMTAFAGSIGIIGIAAILALSNGVNNYIAKVEQDTLSSYPLTITKTSYDLTSFLSSGSSSDDTGDSSSGSSDDATDSGADTVIPEKTLLSDMFADIKSNDLSSFKSFLESGTTDIDSHVNTIKYDYGITPQIYMSDASDGAKQLNPSPLESAMSMSGSSSTLMSMSAFNEMIDDRELLDEQYDVVDGRWPENYDECVLVLMKDGSISDYTLYSMGVLDPDDLQDMVDSAMNSEDVVVPDASANLTYDDVLATTFKVVNSCNLYQYNASQNSWTDMSDDADFMKQAVENGTTLKIVGIVKPSETTTSPALTAGIAYSSDLTKHLMEEAGESEIVKQQLANPDVDVFTGKTFDELQSDQNNALDMSSFFSIDTDALQNAFTFDSSAIDTSGMNIDASSLSGSFDANSFVANMPMPDFSNLSTGGTGASPELTEAQQKQVSDASNALMVGFMTYLANNGGITQTTDFSAMFQKYMSEDPTAQAYVATISGIVTQSMAESIATQMQAAIVATMQDYMTNTFTPYIQGVMEQMVQQMASAMASAMQSSVASMTDSMGSAFSVDENAFADAIKFNMTEEDLKSLITNYANADELTYDNDLLKLGYADVANPASISIYPIDFGHKEKVLDIIDEYNQQMRDEGSDDKVISYTDIMGSLISSVTDIVNTISEVLIAFVSISLVVSSIMIGIITYISVLERKKEIGILRAMGASKRNIASVFNAETVIEGLIAGVFAIAFVLLASIPVNIYILGTKHIANIMSLPWTSALMLIAISVFLTFVAGLIPSVSASRHDPVEALRSE